ncbi:MAG: NAD(P)H dehydrogenase (quinone) [Candidatus Celerinatantimonas neptuna]|nr:MAG: NAD(P)H dehydrogenase (quinone) [Candidatus Celerinatantimonas neptuna]
MDEGKIMIALIYYTKTDITGQLMASVKEAVSKQDIECFSYQIQDRDIVDGRFVNQSILDQLPDAQAIIWGSLTYMGNVSAQFKAFADATSKFWSDQRLCGKIASGVTSGTGLNGDQANTLQYFSTLSSQHGMIWVGLDCSNESHQSQINRLGCQLGIVAQSSDGYVHPGDQQSAYYLGGRVAELVKKLSYA